jgi:hypothetical protein
MRLAISVYRAVGLQEVQYGSEESGRAYTCRAVEAAERLSVVSGQDSQSQEAAAQALWHWPGPWPIRIRIRRFHSMSEAPPFGIAGYKMAVGS